MKSKCLVMGLIIFFVFGVGLGLCSGQSVKMPSGGISPVSVSLEKSAAHSLQTATEFLVGSQEEDGSWSKDPAITALVVYSLLLSPGYDPDGRTETSIAKGLDYITQFVQPDGGIYRKEYRNYVTAVCLMALTRTQDKKYAKAITGAKDFLIQFQLDEGEGIQQSNPYYGGIGYGGDTRPDMSNTQLALEAIRAAEGFEKQFSGVLLAQAGNIESDEQELGLHWKKALMFVNRCQNLQSVNDMPYAGKDGGFIYETGTYKQDRSHSYGSMTYAGVKSLLYANVDKNDERVQKAVEWIKNNYTLDFNPGFGTYSIFYYYMTFSKCMAALGEETLTDALGQEHHWREDLVSKLVSIQKPEGYWQNPSNRYWENVKPLATAYSVIAMKFALESDQGF
ncbi:cycloartenol synthase-like protein [Desulfatibacillum aliphaticivorans]|uniref:Cycloartenol synthase-like protein n=1 Tax=Desulfatibacillum aliphaticivorans TaxID=218208 RepID=B8F921_DESAL|nr:prenyltransferase/squalene oxidase repeat-containing protein [Desulfatibacillum aliphaticivorans]ACL02053.1 cycloartenol synthase-like protein [Desulfatibacillum aliphaticivorans]